MSVGIELGTLNYKGTEICHYNKSPEHEVEQLRKRLVGYIK
jgi:hypothetical protein